MEPTLQRLVKLPPQEVSDEVQERTPVAVYPRQRRGLTVYAEDLACLAPQRYLDDQVINFVLRVFALKPDGEPRDPRVRVCDSHFYSQATRGVTGVQDTVALGGNLQRVQRWYRTGGPFNVPCVLVPICENLHWYLAVVLRMGTEEARVCILDSFGHGVRQRSAVLLAQVVKMMSAEIARVAISHVPALQQPNTTDCGLYLLHHARAVIGFISQGKVPTDEALAQALVGVPMSREQVAVLVQEVGKAEAVAEAVAVTTVTAVAEEGTTADKTAPPPLVAHAEDLPYLHIEPGTSVEVDGHISLENPHNSGWLIFEEGMSEMLRFAYQAAADLSGTRRRMFVFARIVGGASLRFRIQKSNRWRITRRKDASMLQ